MARRYPSQGSVRRVRCRAIRPRLAGASTLALASRYGEDPAERTGGRGHRPSRPSNGPWQRGMSVNRYIEELVRQDTGEAGHTFVEAAADFMKQYESRLRRGVRRQALTLITPVPGCVRCGGTVAPDGHCWDCGDNEGVSPQVNIERFQSSSLEILSDTTQCSSVIERWHRRDFRQLRFRQAAFTHFVR